MLEIRCPSSHVWYPGCIVCTDGNLRIYLRRMGCRIWGNYHERMAVVVQRPCNFPHINLHHLGSSCSNISVSCFLPITMIELGSLHIYNSFFITMKSYIKISYKLLGELEKRLYPTKLLDGFPRMH